MTGMMMKVYEETYKGYAIEIIQCSSSAPGGPVNYWQTFRVCPITSEEVLDKLYSSLPEEYAQTLAEARAYCDLEIEEAQKLPLTLSNREAKNLRRALKLAEQQHNLPTLELQKKLESLLEKR